MATFIETDWASLGRALINATSQDPATRERGLAELSNDSGLNSVYGHPGSFTAEQANEAFAVIRDLCSRDVISEGTLQNAGAAASASRYGGPLLRPLLSELNHPELLNSLPGRSPIVTSLVAHFLERAGVPASVVRNRLNSFASAGNARRLGPNALRVARLAAVAGDAFSPDLARQLPNPPHVTRGLEAMESAGLMQHGRLTAAARSVLLEDLPQQEKQSLEALVAHHAR
jgi:hypothetical protein